MNELYPEIPESYKIIIAGRNPEQIIFDMIKNKPNITLIPNPADMNDIVREGNIFLSPARLGSGIKVRITDGLKCGLPVIAHKTSSRGYETYISKGFFKVFSNPKDFILQLEDLVNQIESHTITPDEIVNTYNVTNSFESAIKHLSPILYMTASNN